MSITIPEAVKQMLAIVELLCKTYPKKRFTLDGRLVGDIGEVPVEEAYDLTLFEDITKHHDAECSDGRLVQVTATMKKTLTFPADHVPHYYLGVLVGADGTFLEVFNGAGAILQEAVKGRNKAPKSSLHSISVASLRKLQSKVAEQDRIPLRSNKRVQSMRDTYPVDQHA
ncbi:hypothetical protein [Massilia sp. NR 4-1]|uniref:DUF6998 domain-containing protein n=1 Tax=Massilia sp. NR 4-1 TaxID=1678028 RepID=UPI0006A28C1F|nr:hypothetical protein [Massilia sp. NR 4-1]AKU20781.1 hypothetical protein ACZ75_03915 [Massilia sp. NR 4-1]